MEYDWENEKVDQGPQNLSQDEERNSAGSMEGQIQPRDLITETHGCDDQNHQDIPVHGQEEARLLVPKENRLKCSVGSYDHSG